MPEPELTNVSYALQLMAASYPQLCAIRDPRGQPQGSYRSLTLTQLEADVDLLARGLVASGVTPRQRLALLVPPSIEFITLVFALLRAGAVQILIDPGMGRKNLIRCLSEAEPTGIVGVPMAQTIRRWLRGRFPLAKHNVTVGQRAWWGGWSLQQIRELGRTSTSIELPSTALDDPAAVIFTTGSTGPPKGVLYRHRNFVAQVELIRMQYQIQPGEVDVPCFPLFGLFNAAMGVTTVLPVMNFSRPASCNPTEIIDRAILANQATQSFASPAVWDKVGRVCEERGQQLSGMRRVLSAGAPVQGPILARMLAALPETAELHTPYGATEALPIATISAREVLQETWPQTERGAGVCVGQRFPQVEWQVIRISLEPIAELSQVVPLSAGEIGELIVRGPMVTTEYVTRREANAMAKIADPRGGIWHRMGDAGYLDAQQRFWFCGRVGHRVLTPLRAYESVCVEGIANTHPLVRRTALVGIGPPGQQRPVLIVEPLNMRRRFGFGWHWPSTAILDQIRAELLERMMNFPQTTGINELLYHPNFPVDIRHNAKIFREQLANWASTQIT